MIKSQGISLKKYHGQHFLRDATIVAHMLEAVTIDATKTILEIGCGDGFLTQVLVHTLARQIVVFEIDHEWAVYVRNMLQLPNLEIFEQDILKVDPEFFLDKREWIVLANLPYHITFPILDLFIRIHTVLSAGVIMIQEEVAQKLVATGGRPYGFISLYFQSYFIWKLLDKIPPSAFYPPPKVTSRLVHFVPRTKRPEIINEVNFWTFIRHCFKQPRRTLLNNLKSCHYSLEKTDPAVLQYRAQQLSFDDLLTVWTDIQRC